MPIDTWSPQQTIDAFIILALPGALRIKEVNFKACVDPELSMLDCLHALVPGQ
jgi:hypothetical protein